MLTAHLNIRSFSANRRRRPALRAGFTLVELMISMMILGLLTSIIYGLFHTTAETLTEVDSLAETTDIARFALEHVRNDLQAAGSQATPDSKLDSWSQPKPSTVQVRGLLPYSGWRGKTIGDLMGGTDGAALSTANPQSRFDGMVIVGAYDIPQSVMLGNVAAGSARINTHVRGLHRIVLSDPFRTEVSTPSGFDITTPSTKAAVEQKMATRLVRLTDRQGFFHFTGIKTAVADGTGMALEFDPSLKVATGGAPYGIESVAEVDVEYDAAFLDGFWYRVVPDPFDRSNLQLVRERVDISTLHQTTLEPALATWAPASSLVSDRVVIANRVVDFRLWFDCGETTNGIVTDIAWNQGWTTPASSCMEGANKVPHLARVAHIRLSVRTEHERPNRPHLTVTNDASWRGFEAVNGPMRSYDIEPNAIGSASVVTVQATVELTNFAMRNIF
ncbi:MAG: prepilin-type N-terminal cleavage/methylation domain-containing protein [Bradymonadaceae bacterium]|nr:prepilin-type N-terminal cleavage/methylation domain-containing protein [Lujinxingiaceae bacterium]